MKVFEETYDMMDNRYGSVLQKTTASEMRNYFDNEETQEKFVEVNKITRGFTYYVDFSGYRGPELPPKEWVEICNAKFCIPFHAELFSKVCIDYTNGARDPILCIESGDVNFVRTDTNIAEIFISTLWPKFIKMVNNDTLYSL